MMKVVGLMARSYVVNEIYIVQERNSTLHLLHDARASLLLKGQMK